MEITITTPIEHINNVWASLRTITERKIGAVLVEETACLDALEKIIKQIQLKPTERIATKSDMNRYPFLMYRQNTSPATALLQQLGVCHGQAVNFFLATSETTLRPDFRWRFFAAARIALMSKSCRAAWFSRIRRTSSTM